MLRVLGIDSRRSAKNSVRFLEERMLDEFPFPNQCIQSDGGAEFFNLAFHKAMRIHGIRFRPVRSPRRV